MQHLDRVPGSQRDPPIENPVALARDHGVEMPITEVVAGVTQGRIGMAEAVMLLASRSAKPERYGL